jgi:D-serine deaminase-like pyridoxal phosphate-dependent protein
MLKGKFEEVTMKAGDELGLLGMQIKMDREVKQVLICQPNHVDRVIEAFDVVKGAPNPALIKLWGMTHAPQC